MDNGIALIAIVVTAVVGCTIVWLALRRNLPPEAVTAIAAYAAAIRNALGNVIDDDKVRTLAGAAWDAWGDGAKYFSRDEFIELVLAALSIEPQASAEIASYQAQVGLR